MHNKDLLTICHVCGLMNKLYNKSDWIWLDFDTEDAFNMKYKCYIGLKKF